MIDPCEADFEDHQSTCSGLDRAAAARLEVTLTSDADAVVVAIGEAGGPS